MNKQLPSFTVRMILPLTSTGSAGGRSLLPQLGFCAGRRELNWSPRLGRQLGAGILTLRGSNSDSLDMRSAVLGEQLGGPSKDVANMAEVFRGLYRTIAWAYVTNGTMEFQVPEADYRAFGYEPNYDNLPWKENYDAAKGHEERFKY